MGNVEIISTPRVPRGLSEISRHTVQSQCMYQQTVRDSHKTVRQASHDQNTSYVTKVNPPSNLDELRRTATMDIRIRPNGDRTGELRLVQDVALMIQRTDC